MNKIEARSSTPDFRLGRMIESENPTPPKLRSDLRTMPVPWKKVRQAAFTHESDLGLVAWFEECVARAAKKRFTENDVLVTPALASFLLDRNPANRDVSDQIVFGYSEDMRTGNWMPNGEAVKISIEGLLNDGQHRCWAAALYDVSFVTDFTFGLPRESRFTLDQGKKRTGADILGIRGDDLGNKSTIIAAVRFLLAHKGIAHRPTNITVANAVPDFPGIDDFASFARRVSKAIGIPAPGLGTAIAYLLNERCSRDNELFWAKLASGSNLSENDPILRLRNRLISIRSAHQSIPPREMFALFIKTWNNFRSGTPMQRSPIWVASVEKFPEIL